MIDNPYTMVVVIVFIAVIGGVLREWAKARQAAPPPSGETKALRNDVAALQDRIKVLERIAIEKEDSLTRQIEELRDR